jgi:DNA-binding NarL/FixJ family response regulator
VATECRRSTPRPRVLIADDDPDVRAALAQLAERLELVASARDADEAIAPAAEHQPDIAIVDVQMAGGGGVAATRGIRAAAASSTTTTTTTVALSADEPERTCSRCSTPVPSPTCARA